jgi:hypothetical protein
MASISGFMLLFSSIRSISCTGLVLARSRTPSLLPTRYIFIENIIFFDDIVNDLLRSLIDDQHLPL